MRYFERFFEVFFLQILLQYPGVEVVVHVVIKPRQCTLFNGLETLRRNWLAVCRFFDTHVGHIQRAHGAHAVVDTTT